MSITDELREYVIRVHRNGWFDRRVCDDLLEITDRIDERYHRDMATAQQVGINEGEDAAMRDGWVELPKDADGVPIRVGDRMAFEDGEEFDVIGISDSTLFFMDDDFADAAAWTQAGNKHHVKPDSWERIIQDAVKLGYADYPTTYQEAELVERCKRLAGEA